MKPTAPFRSNLGSQSKMKEIKSSKHYSRFERSGINKHTIRLDFTVSTSVDLTSCDFKEWRKFAGRLLNRFEHDGIPPKSWKIGGRRLRGLLAPFDVSAVNCLLQFFTADPYDVQAASLRRPASTVIKFDPATRETTSSKRGYPNPMAPFLRGYRCPRPWRCRQIKIQLCRLTRLDRCIVDGSFDSAVHNQRDSVIACRETI
jgi:hypothetical protein